MDAVEPVAGGRGAGCPCLLGRSLPGGLFACLLTCFIRSPNEKVNKWQKFPPAGWGPMLSVHGWAGRVSGVERLSSLVMLSMRLLLFFLSVSAIPSLPPLYHDAAVFGALLGRNRCRHLQVLAHRSPAHYAYVMLFLYYDNTVLPPGIASTSSMRGFTARMDPRSTVVRCGVVAVIYS